MEAATAFRSTALSAGIGATILLGVGLFTVTVTVTGYLIAEIPAAVAVNFAPANGFEGSNGWSGRDGWHCGSWTGESVSPSLAPPPANAAASSQAQSSSPAPASDSCSPLTPAAPPPSVPPAAPANPSPVPSAVSSDYQQGILDSHNIHRDNASVPHLIWDDHMASIADQIAVSCVYAHDTSTGGGGYGQNIGAGAPPEEIPAMVTNEMYNDEIDFYPGYGFEPDMSNFEKWGHYSQIVWKSSTGVGCATQHCLDGLANTGDGVNPYFTVCNYNPPGNVDGEYAANVLQPGDAPTVTLKRDRRRRLDPSLQGMKIVLA